MPAARARICSFMGAACATSASPHPNREPSHDLPRPRPAARPTVSCATGARRRRRAFHGLGQHRPPQFRTSFVGKIVCRRVAHVQGGRSVGIHRHNRRCRFRPAHDHHSLAAQRGVNQLSEPRLGLCNRRLRHGAQIWTTEPLRSRPSSAPRNMSPLIPAKQSR